jgi:hypothetical protein
MTLTPFVVLCARRRREPSEPLVIENLRKRDRQRARLMQAEVDGRGQAIATPAFIEPAQFKGRVHPTRSFSGADSGGAPA